MNMLGEQYLGLKQYVAMDVAGNRDTIRLWSEDKGYAMGRNEAIEVIEGLMRFCRCFAQHHTDDIRYTEAQAFLNRGSGL